ncbi:integrin alpha-4 precursor [Xenopus laevis]|uniref:Integrin alpha-4 n=1 Tax=Xenopus laevis TaxID=8355 RepID=ITA4_XENLA|nr:integrin alpha-4 precursor [Xenopus laevis]Q91687.1 RecName: Full=Integrin alpha-4; AltName: Full=Integrin alpha-IV; AltName: Full=VLA-4 subunit alpha; Flags: Precursor [Xenopus laevis]AAA98673.1 integrin alpha 4 [Xenopus laevis]
MIRDLGKVGKVSLLLDHIWTGILLYTVILTPADCYNIDESSPMLFKGSPGSLFGFSVVLHSNGEGNWIVVGAPQSSWTTKNVSNPGAILKCKIQQNPNRTCDGLELGNQNGAKCGKTCKEEQDNQWLGVSLSRQPTKDGQILACGHRWKNTHFMLSDHKLPYGVCYGIPADFRTELSKRICPCYKDHVRKFGDRYGSCQAGISTFYVEDVIIMGAPGSFYWTGSIFVYNTTENTIKSYVDLNNAVKFGSYLGYSVGAGHFRTPNGYDVIGGAPQQEQTGRVYIFTYEEKQLTILFEAGGKKLGSYFGAAVCAADLNGDGLSDLLVGAPIQSTIREEGRVFVYMNTGSGAMEELKFELSGSDLYAARFGETIANLGDIDNDGFEDVAIAAPQEGDLEGAVYIYNGREKGITPSFSQRLQGSKFGYGLRMFGQSLSNVLDIDGNGYQDVAIGAFLSDSAVLLRTRPVIIIDAFLKLPSTVNKTKFECMENGVAVVCMNVTVCFAYQGLDVPGYIVMFYNITSDVRRKSGTPARFYFVSNGSSDVISGTVEIRQKSANCKTHQAFMRKDTRDIFTPIHMESSYYLGKHIVSKRSADDFQPLQPVLQQKEGKGNVITNKVYFARYCNLPNCSADLQITGKRSFPKPFESKTYLAVGGMKSLMINITLFNGGDDAFQTVLRLRLPKGLYFVKVFDLLEKEINCAVNKEENEQTRLDCSVGHFYVDAFSKQEFSFLLDSSALIRAEEDLVINATVACANELIQDTMWNNEVSFIVPTRYEIDLNVLGTVSPFSFVFGPREDKPDDSCIMEEIEYTFNVINAGSSLVPAAKLQISLPNTFAPNDIKLFNILAVKTTVGECYFDNSTRDCETPKNTRSKIGDLFAFFSRPDKRWLYCIKDDPSCLQILCLFGDMERESKATVEVQLEISHSHLERDEAMLIQFFTTAQAGFEDSFKIINLNQDHHAYVVLEALHNLKPKKHVIYMIIGISLLLGILLFSLLTYILWKVGFFRRKYQPIGTEETSRRESWNYLNKDEKEVK